jgi:hypothetical protein
MGRRGCGPRGIVLDSLDVIIRKPFGDASMGEELARVPFILVAYHLRCQALSVDLAGSVWLYPLAAGEWWKSWHGKARRQGRELSSLVARKWCRIHVPTTEAEPQHFLSKRDLEEILEVV